MIKFQAFNGTVTMIDDFSIGQNNEVGCYKLISVDDGYGATVNFVVAPTTYFVDHVMVTVGDRVSGYYDANAPVPLIYPPQFQALVMARDTAYQTIKVDHFNRQLESSDGTLRLNIGPHTRILLENGQAFTASIGDRNLIVVYGATTRSIPAQTTPTSIIVMC